MPLVSGKDGKVTAGGAELADITRWKFASSDRGVSFASSATDGYRRRLPGAKEGQGSFEFVLNQEEPVTGGLAEGSSVTLLLHVDEERYYSVPAVIDRLQLEVDITSGDLVAGSAEFATDGAWSVPVF